MDLIILMLDVYFYCQFNNTGIGRHCHNVFDSLAKLASPSIRLHYIDQTNIDAVRGAVTSRGSHPKIHAFFRRAPAHLVNLCSGTRFVWWAFESDSLPTKWLKDVQPYDEIWVPSHWGRTVLLAHGVSQNRIRVVELGVNTARFYPSPINHDGFIFLSVGKYEKRKSTDEIVEAFTQEFPLCDYPSVQLWLKADFPLFPSRVPQLAERLRYDGRIRVLSGEATDETMAQVYGMADAFVFPSKAEGFGLPCIEAIACGVPVIASDVTGQSTFLRRIPGLFEPVAYNRIPIIDEDYRHFYEADYGNLDFGTWAAPDISSLRNAMRKVFENPEKSRALALRASMVIRDEFSWEVIAGKTLAGIKELHLRSAPFDS